jgi:hypothetical protein
MNQCGAWGRSLDCPRCLFFLDVRQACRWWTYCIWYLYHYYIIMLRGAMIHYVLENIQIQIQIIYFLHFIAVHKYSLDKNKNNSSFTQIL